jgi:PadR family transcriptional regulator PadR
MGETKERREGVPVDMAKHEAPDLLPGTLDLLILRTLARGEMHGYGIAQHLKAASNDVLQVGESSLYPALQRLLLNGWVKAEWGASENNRRARYYTLTAAGRKRLTEERQEFDRLVLAIQQVLAT